MISFKNISKQYKNKVALEKINLNIKSHEFFVLVGPSGSGKTTLLKMINRLNAPTSGEIIIDAQNIADIKDLKSFRRQIGYVLQSGALFPNLTVAQNIELTLDLDKISLKDKNYKIRDMLKKVDLDPDDFMNRMPNELSGGEAQRVGIVRALIFDPKIILMDEPFSALDPLARRQLQKLVLALHQEFKTTIVFVTHDMQEALNLSSRLAVLNNGSIQQVGTPDEIITHPANDFVANFFYNADTEKDYIKSILDAGLGNPVNTNKNSNECLKVTDTIYELAKTLQLSDDSTVIVDDQQLTTSDLMQYLSMQAEAKF